MTTSKNSMERRTEELSTLLQEDIRVSPSVLPGSKKAQKMTVTSGRQCLKLSKLSGPVGSLLKMCLVTSGWDSTRCFLTWKPVATPRNRLLFQLFPSTPHIEGTGSGLLPTPTPPELWESEKSSREQSETQSGDNGKAQPMARTVSHSEHDGPSPTEITRRAMEAAIRRPIQQNETGESQGTSGSGVLPTMGRELYEAAPDTHDTRRRPCNETMERGLPEQPDSSGIQPGKNDTNSGSSRLQRATKKPFFRFPHLSSKLERSGQTIGIRSDSDQSLILGTTTRISNRVDRVKSLGNSVVPQIPEILGRFILEVENSEG